MGIFRKQKEERKNRFYEKFYEGDRNSIHCKKHKTYATPFEAISFLDEEVSLAVAQREKEVVDMIMENVDEDTRQDLESYKFIQDLITKPNDKPNN